MLRNDPRALVNKTSTVPISPFNALTTKVKKKRREISSTVQTFEICSVGPTRGQVYGQETNTTAGTRI